MALTFSVRVGSLLVPTLAKITGNRLKLSTVRCKLVICCAALSAESGLLSSHLIFSRSGNGSPRASFNIESGPLVCRSFFKTSGIRVNTSWRLLHSEIAFSPTTKKWDMVAAVASHLVKVEPEALKLGTSWHQIGTEDTKLGSPDLDCIGHSARCCL